MNVLAGEERRQAHSCISGYRFCSDEPRSPARNRPEGAILRPLAFDAGRVVAILFPTSIEARGRRSSAFNVGEPTQARVRSSASVRDARSMTTTDPTIALLRRALPVSLAAPCCEMLEYNGVHVPLVFSAWIPRHGAPRGASARTYLLRAAHPPATRKSSWLRGPFARPSPHVILRGVCCSGRPVTWPRLAARE